MPTFKLSYEQIVQAATEKSECFPWGYKDYIKVDGAWVLSHLLIVDRLLGRPTRSTRTLARWKSSPGKESSDEHPTLSVLDRS